MVTLSRFFETGLVFSGLCEFVRYSYNVVIISGRASWKLPLFQIIKVKYDLSLKFHSLSQSVNCSEVLIKVLMIWPLL